jgi:cytochrome-b5 reductase
LLCSFYGRRVLTKWKERTESDAQTTPEVVPRDTETASEDINKKHIRAIVPTLSAGLVLITGILWLVSRVSKRLPGLQNPGDFWTGFGILSFTSVSLAMATGLWFKSLVKSQTNESFPTRIKAGINIAQRRSINSGVLNPREFRSLPLIEKHKISPDTYRFFFGLPEPGSLLGLPTGQQELYSRVDQP